MSIGYACLTLGVSNTDFRTCLQKNVTENKMAELVEHNLNSLENIIDYNTEAGIYLFRISSDVIPFGSHPKNNFHWGDIFKEKLNKIGNKISENDVRVSMHPGQYTVLNSPDEKVSDMAVEDLSYHSRFLDSLGTDASSKIILHIGGVYGDKKAALERFEERYRDLDEKIKRRLVIENDDKSFNISDVLELGVKLGIPVVYDNLHNVVNCCDKTKDDKYWVSECARTWSICDGKQKIHYSQQDERKKPGSHSETVEIIRFLDFYEHLSDNKPDIMLEVKDKNLSAVKCINCTSENCSIKDLEHEWSRYKYLVLEKSPQIYNNIRTLLKDKRNCSAVSFYALIDSALKIDAILGYEINAAQHVWGYYKDLVSEKEKSAFHRKLELFASGETSINTLKRGLWKLAENYNQEYLLKSYYFLS